MKTRIQKYKEKLNEIKGYLQRDLAEYMKGIDWEKPNSDIQIINLKCEADINRAIYGRGFYIILTDHVFEVNKCKFTTDNKTEIYRGHSYFVKKRLLSQKF
jgi:hypothetical protein